MFRFEVERSGYISKSCITPYMSDQGYFYISIPIGSHGRVKRIWINRKAVVRQEEEFTIVDWLTYRKTEKGNIVLMPSDNKNSTIIYLIAECGYRGSSKIEILTPETAELVFEGAIYDSPRGSLGVSSCGLYKVKDGAVFKISRTGRLYGADPVITVKVVFTHEGIDLIRADELSDEELAQLL